MLRTNLRKKRVTISTDMSKYRSIAVIYGCDTSENEISCLSGEFVAARIDGKLYDVYEIYARFGKWSLVAYRVGNSLRVNLPEEQRPEVDKNDFSVKVHNEKVKFDYAYIVQHGSPGENGLLQGYFEMLDIPFSTCSAFVSSVAFDKYVCKNMLKDCDFVKFAPDAHVRKGDDLDAFVSKVATKLKFPLFVKPTQGGSSFGVTRVSEISKLKEAVKFAFSEGTSVLVEQAISGREFTVAAYKYHDKVEVLPCIEIVTDNEYFDYDAKYNGQSEELCPAPIDESVAKMLSEVTRKLYSVLECRGVVRFDFILAEDGLYFLECNTVPGMTSGSLVPKMVNVAGFEISDFLTRIIESS